MRDPRTAEEWQSAVDGANFLLLLVRAAGTNRGRRVRVDVARCEELLRDGKAIGFEPCSFEEYVAREFGRTA